MDENEPPSASGILKDRPTYEKQVLESKDVIGVVVRPAFVFGKKSNQFVQYFQQSKEGKVFVLGKPDIKWSEVHIDDLVDGYLKIIEAPSGIIDGQIFHFADDSRNSNMEIATAFSKVAGYSGTIEVEMKGVKEHNQKTVLVDYRKASRILGWQPRHLLLLDEVETYYQAWKQKQIL